MKLLRSLAIVAGLCSTSAWSQTADTDAIVGLWAGTMTVDGQEVHLLFEIEAGDASLAATMNGPSQGWPPLTMDDASFDGSRLVIRNEVQEITYEAALTAPGRLAGTFRQRERVLDLPMFKAPAIAELPVESEDTASVAGIWEGAIKVRGRDLPLVFHVATDGDALTATMDSPTQGIAAVAMNDARFSDGRLLLVMAEAGIRYDGVLVEPDRMMGLFTQGPLKLGLTLSRVDSPTAVESAIPDPPQTPKPPFPYDVEEVTFGSEIEGSTLTGSLTLPEDVRAVAVIVSGSGQQTRDGAVSGHRIYLVLADHLSRHGIAVLRYDDRGIGGSRGPLLTATSRNFANDTAAALDYIGRRDDLAGKPLGVIGHSEGGEIATMLGAERDDLAFLVLMAGPAVGGIESLDAQNRAIYEGAGLPAELVEARLEILRRLTTIMAGDGDVEGPAAEAEAYLATVLDRYTAAQMQRMGLGTDSNALLQPLRVPWMRAFLAYDPAVDLERIEIPVLALYGTRDTQVVAAQNAPAMRAALEAAGNTHFEVRVLENLNHLFQTAVTGLPNEYARIEETTSPVALNAISDWILQTSAERR